MFARLLLVDTRRGDEGRKRRSAVALLSGVAAALTGLAIPAAVRCLGIPANEAGDASLMGSLCGVSLGGSSWMCTVVCARHFERLGETKFVDGDDSSYCHTLVRS